MQVKPLTFPLPMLIETLNIVEQCSEEPLEVARCRLRDRLDAQALEFGRASPRRGARTPGCWSLPRSGIGARYGLSVSIRQRSSGTKRRDLAQLGGVLERQDAGKRDVKAQIERGAGHLGGFGEAMEDAAGSPPPSSRRIASVSAEALRVWMTSGLPARARGADVHAKALALPLHLGDAAAVQAVVVEPGLADRDDLRQRAPARRSSSTRRLAARPPRPDGRRRCTRSCRSRAPARGRARTPRASCRCTARGRPRPARHRGADLRQARRQLGEAQVAVGIDEHGVRRGPHAGRRRGTAARRSDRLRRLDRRDRRAEDLLDLRASARGSSRRSGSARRRPGCGRPRRWPA